MREVIKSYILMIAVKKCKFEIILLEYKADTNNTTVLYMRCQY